MIDGGAAGMAAAEREVRYEAAEEGSFDKFRIFLDEIITDGDWEYGDGTSMTEDVWRILEMLKTTSPRKSPSWISVNDRLPPNRDLVWAYDVQQDLVRALYYVACGWWKSIERGVDLDGVVTHWQPIDKPEPPR